MHFGDKEAFGFQAMQMIPKEKKSKKRVIVFSELLLLISESWMSEKENGTFQEKMKGTKVKGFVHLLLLIGSLSIHSCHLYYFRLFFLWMKREKPYFYILKYHKHKYRRG